MPTLCRHLNEINCNNIQKGDQRFKIKSPNLVTKERRIKLNK